MAAPSKVAHGRLWGNQIEKKSGKMVIKDINMKHFLETMETFQTVVSTTYSTKISWDLYSCYRNSDTDTIIVQIP